MVKRDPAHQGLELRHPGCRCVVYWTEGMKFYRRSRDGVVRVSVIKAW